ncbi:MAG: cell division transport system ATP-binding protein [Candidatus Berkelbacteria bacterium Licking1014_85]|uniref:Cell division ATP-binding protein FtsE n=1 Tax=Candidatus Berkelbacteria bacterium Licking1014_85 TaxID=2017148 RepID=A0A554LH78_9BACT|nr:MAG: cell division transport system ATP-binding protein [Candidatus Berkelbacteria bacterium Licking1014_85]
MRLINTKTKIEISEKTDRALISIEKISKKYKDIIALKDVSFDINAGEFASIVGPSGAGKSTLVRLLIREELPSEGQIYIANRDIFKIKRYQLPFYRRKIGVIFQDYKLLEHKTVKENIIFALEVSDASDDEISNRVPKILNLVGLSDRLDNFPRQLSGGERQRVSIARALVHSPKILIADEPTGNLDPDNAKEVIDLLLKIHSSGTTVILATHDKPIVDNLKKRVVKLVNGSVEYDKNIGGYD